MMRVRAIRLAEVGRFTSPVALEGLSGRLDVLAGPNEFGKSTIFTALRAVLFEKHTASGKDIQRLRPYRGGAPIVEVEFEARGTQWRVRKQFLSGKKAEITDLGSGRLLRNQDADTELSELLRGPEQFERFGLLWVGQEASVTDLLKVNPGSGALSLVESEVAALSVDAVARAVHERVRTELAALQTPKTAKPTGEWLTTIRERDRAQSDLRAVRERLQAQTDRLAALASAIAARDALAAPEPALRRSEAVRVAERARVAAEADITQRRDAEQALKLAESALAAAEAELRLLDTQGQEIARLIEDETNNAKALTEQTARAAQLEARRSAYEQEVVAHAAEVQRLTALKAASDARRRADEALVERGELDRKIENARSLIAAQANAEATAKALAPFTTVVLDEIETLEHRLQRLDLEFAAAAPEVTVSLALDGAGRILRDGVPITAPVTFRPEDATVLSVPGIGDIRITPNSASATDAKRRERDQLKGDLARRFAQLGVSGKGELTRQLRERSAAAQSAQDAGIRLDAIAPQGVEALVARRAHLDAVIAAGNVEVANGLQSAAIEADLIVEQKKLAAGQLKVGLIGRDIEADAQRREALIAMRTKIARELSVLRQKAGPGDDAAAMRAAAEQRLDTARAGYAASKRARDAWGAPVDVTELEAALAAARAIEVEAEKRIVALEREIAGHAAALGATRDDDIEAEAQKLTDELGRLEDRLRRFETRAAALTRLESELARAADQQRSIVVAPVLNRIAPYLTRVFGAADLQLDPGFAPEKLTREGVEERLADLSFGTREQVAILTRLGLAKLLAERDAAVPVVLDDALVYADDTRISRIFDVLTEASALHQVIVLTCREATFRAMRDRTGAHELTLQAWDLER